MFKNVLGTLHLLKSYKIIMEILIDESMWFKLIMKKNIFMNMFVENTSKKLKYNYKIIKMKNVMW